MGEDVRYALRQMWTNPGFAVTAIVTLGLGIGAAAAMFGLVQGVLLSPPPYSRADRLVLLNPSRVDGQPYRQGSTVGQWIDWRSSRTIDPPSLYRWSFNFLVLSEGSESLGGMFVTTDYFRTVGLRPVVGREFTAAEAGRLRVPPSAIILGYDLWQRRFNGDPKIVGTTVRISRFQAPLPVVGVMPPGVRFLPDPLSAAEPNYDVNARVDFWLATTPDETRPGANGWNAVARLRDDASVAQAQAELGARAVRQVQDDPGLAGLTVDVRPLVDQLNDQGRALLVPLVASVALVFCVACVNVAGLFVARGLQRHREFAMRSALGATRLRLFRQLLTESVAVSMVGAVAGAAIAAAGVAVFRSIGGNAIPRGEDVTVGWQVYLFGAAAALVAAIVAGLVPALRASSPRHAQDLKGTRTSAGRGERRLLAGIATLQVVLTVALLGGAALLIRTASNLARVRPGFDVENILALTVTTVTPNSFKPFHTQVLERVAALPGVTHAAFVWGLPLTGNYWPGTLEPPGSSDPGRPGQQVSVPLRSVTPDYFDLMGMAFAEGRTFRASDNADAPRVAVINQTLARRYFPGTSAVGRSLTFPGDPKRTVEVVGVLADTRTDALSDAATPEIYFPFWQNGAFSKHLVVRSGSDPRTLTALVRREVRAVDPTAAVERATTMEQIRRESLAPRTFAMRLLIGFALVATSLALVGIYGVLSLSVGARVKEFAVRRAIGAQPRDILRLILTEGGRLVIAGVAIGTIVTTLLGRSLAAQLFEVRPADPLSLAAAALIFGVVSLGACLIPARRAARTSLLAALHEE